MKNLLGFIVIVACLCFSCNDAPTTPIMEVLATKNIDKHIKDFFQDEPNAKLDNCQVLFSNDSLCIMNVEIKKDEFNDKSLTEKFEYTLLFTGENLYYVFSKLQQEDNIFIAEEELESAKSEAKYRNLNYANFLFQRCVEAIIINGKKNDDEKRYFTLKAPSEFGIWKVARNQDDFGDEMSSKFIGYMGQGDYYNYNLYAGNFLFTLTIVPKEHSIAFCLYEDRSSLVIEEGCFKLRIKEKNGKTHVFSLISENGYIATWSEKGVADEIIKILSREEEMSLILQANHNLQKSYKFKINPAGYKKSVEN